MGRFYSIGGMDASGQRNRPSARPDYGKLAESLYGEKIEHNAQYREYIASRKRRNLNVAPDIPFDLGEKGIYHGNDDAEVIGADYNDHSGTTRVHIRSGRKEYVSEFERVSEHAVEVARSRRVF